MVAPTYQSVPGDKAGKDNNFRGLTEFNGQLYLTKGSGSNGIDTVYTVSNPGGALPTAATAASAEVSILPGFSTQPASTGPTSPLSDCSLPTRRHSMWLTRALATRSTRRITRVSKMDPV